MADRAFSTSRRAVLGAAAALPFLPLHPAGAQAPEARPSPPTQAEAEWNARLARYNHLAARARAAAETGWFRAANDRYYREAADPTADHQAAFARLDRAEDLYWHRCVEPLETAAVALVLTPASGGIALNIKISIVRAHQLTEANFEDRECLGILQHDLMQLLCGLPDAT
jgi:hypothetical protein